MARSSPIAALSKGGGAHTAHVHPSGVEEQMASRLSPKPSPWQAILLATQPQHGVSGAPWGCPCWMLAPQPGQGGLVSAFLQACDEMMPKQHMAQDCPAPLSQAGWGCWMISVSLWKKRV